MPLDVRNPYDRSRVCLLDYDDGNALEVKVERSRAAFERWRQVPLHERSAQVEAGLERFRAGAEAIAVDITRQMGKPLTQARREVETLFERAERLIAIAPDALAPDVLPELPGLHRRIEHTPLGVVLELAAWNYPLIIPVNVVVPALLAGNTVLLKHSATTPLCGQAFERAFGALAIPDLVTSLVLTHERTARLIADRRVAHVAFTGSVEGGHAVYREAARRFIDVGLELGGKDPAYVAEDADLAFAAANIVDGACYNAGQSCCAVERVYVHRARVDEYLERAREALEAYRLGDPMQEATTLGPLAHASAGDRLDAQIADARRRGARVITGGRRPDDRRGNFYEPTLLADVPHDAAVMQEESFGPLLPVMAVDDDEQALAMIQDTRYGLTASVWTADRERAEWLARSIEAGTVFQNRCDYLDPALPWTGVRDSGKGSTLSRYGFYHVTRPKSIHFRTVT